MLLVDGEDGDDSFGFVDVLWGLPVAMMSIAPPFGFFLGPAHAFHWWVLTSVLLWSYCRASFVWSTNVGGGLRIILLCSAVSGLF